MSTKKQINLAVEMQRALNMLLEYKESRRRMMEEEDDTKYRWYAEYCYVTGTELERQVRKNLGAEGRWNGVQISGLQGSSLMQVCRAFLYNHPELSRFNFQSGSISGMRFRTADMPISDSEQRTMAAKTKEKPVHYTMGYKAVGGSGPLCTINNRVKPKTRLTFRSSQGRNNTRTTQDTALVTCSRCLKAIEAGKHETPREVSLEEKAGKGDAPVFQVIDEETGGCLHWTYVGNRNTKTRKEAKAEALDWIKDHNVTLVD
jgi:hypothetical protein